MPGVSCCTGMINLQDVDMDECEDRCRRSKSTKKDELL